LQILVGQAEMQIANFGMQNEGEARRGGKSRIIFLEGQPGGAGKDQCQSTNDKGNSERQIPREEVYILVGTGSGKIESFWWEVWDYGHFLRDLMGGQEMQNANFRMQNDCRKLRGMKNRIIFLEGQPGGAGNGQGLKTGSTVQSLKM
jgi:hypothetical protein